MRLKLFFAFVCVVVVAALAVAYGGRQLLLAPGPLMAEADVIIPTGEGPRAIATRLEQAGVIRHGWFFMVSARVQGVAAKLKAGEYVFEPATPLANVLRKVAEGETRNRTVTIPEGWTVKQAADRLLAAPGLTGDLKRPAEGHIFPDTYAFEFGMDRAKVLAAMEKRMTQELAAVWEKRADGLPLKTPEDALILASIVQKEAASEAEMPKIAGVFINRLKKGMRLQSDPTVIYGAELDEGRLRKKDLTEPHPFNTYVYGGLPPTPIANPGKAALWAATHPEAGEWLYFVADPSRTMHIFSATYEEHQKNVKRYWAGVEKAEKAEKIEKRDEKTEAKKGKSL